jgi:hypothetical protein
MDAPDLLNLSHTSNPQAITPAQQQYLMELAGSLQKPTETKYANRWTALIDALRGGLGGYYAGQAQRGEQARLAQQAQALTGGPASAPSPLPQPPQAQPPQLQAPPGGPTTPGDITARLETGSADPLRGVGSIARDSHGSKSYGNFGLNSQPGASAWWFRGNIGKNIGLTADPGTPEFDRQWQALAATNPKLLHDKELEWYNATIYGPASWRLQAAGIPGEIATDPRVRAYFADRSVQQGPDSTANHADRIQGAFKASGGDISAFLRNMSQADLAAYRHDFPSAIASGVYPYGGHVARITGRLEGSMGLGQPPAGATPPTAPAPGAPSPTPPADPGKMQDRLPAAPTPPADPRQTIPPVKTAPPLYTQEQIQRAVMSGMPEMAQKMVEKNLEMQQPQAVTDPYGHMYVGSAVRGYQDQGIQGKPAIERFPIEAAGVKTETPAMPVQGQGGQFSYRTIPFEGQPQQAVPGVSTSGINIPSMPPSGSTAQDYAQWAPQYKAASEGLTAGAKKVGEESGSVQTQINSDADNALHMKMQLAEMRNLARNINPNAAADVKTAIGNVMQALGFDHQKVTDFLGTDPGNAEAFKKAATALAAEAAHSNFPRTTQNEFQIWLRNATPNTILSPEGLSRIMDYADKGAGMALDRQAEFQKWKQGRAPDAYNDFSAHWNKLKREEIESGAMTTVPGTVGGPQENRAIPVPAAGMRGTAGPDLSKMGPTPVRTPEEARKLPSGTRIQLPDGTVGRVP